MTTPVWLAALIAFLSFWAGVVSMWAALRTLHRAHVLLTTTVMNVMIKQAIVGDSDFVSKVNQKLESMGVPGKIQKGD